MIFALTVLVGLAATLMLIAVGTAKAGEAVAPLAAVNPQIVAWGLVAAALSTGARGDGAGYAVARVGARPFGAIAEKPELFGRVLLLVGLCGGHRHLRPDRLHTHSQPHRLDHELGHHSR